MRKLECVSSWQQHLGWDSRVQAPEGQQQEGISSQKEHPKKELHFLSIWGGGKHQAWPDSPMDGTIPNRSSAQTVTSLTAVAVRICRMVLIMKKFVFKR